MSDEPVEVISGPAETVWTWLKSAPLPVVLAISLMGFSTLSYWISDVAEAADKAKTKAEQAADKAQQADETTKKSDHKIDKLVDKMDQLLEEVVRLRTLQEQADAKKKKGN